MFTICVANNPRYNQLQLDGGDAQFDNSVAFGSVVAASLDLTAEFVTGAAIDKKGRLYLSGFGDVLRSERSVE